ncbi:hypothetical protein B0G76_8656 [Paraburkholderia sp. BL23I1N1]|nr:hypothetical protein B0G76_8656 [Paraburkholderia sp. BL23I1N1]
MSPAALVTLNMGCPQETDFSYYKGSPLSTSSIAVFYGCGTALHFHCDVRR